MGMGDRADSDARTAAERDGLVLRNTVGVGMRDVDGDTDVGVREVAAGPGAIPGDLLLDSEGHGSVTSLRSSRASTRATPQRRSSWVFPAKRSFMRWLMPAVKVTVEPMGTIVRTCSRGSPISIQSSSGPTGLFISSCDMTWTGLSPIIPGRGSVP